MRRAPAARHVHRICVVHSACVVRLRHTTGTRVTVKPDASHTLVTLLVNTSVRNGLPPPVADGVERGVALPVDGMR